MPSRLFLDIETAQTQDKEYIQSVRDNIKPPATIKLQKNADKWFAEEADGAVQAELKKTSFSGLHGSIVSIAWAVNDSIVKSIQRDVGEPEDQLLIDFFDTLYADNGKHFNPTWVGHNLEFDTRFLFLRCVINGIQPLYTIPHNDKPWSKKVFCTLYETMGLVKAGGSLDKIAKAFGVGQKTEGIDGSMVNQFWLDGRIDEIESYNRDDVHLCRQIYKKLTFKTEVGQ